MGGGGDYQGRQTGMMGGIEGDARRQAGRWEEEVGSYGGRRLTPRCYHSDVYFRAGNLGGERSERQMK